MTPVRAIDSLTFDPTLNPNDGTVEGRVSCALVSEFPDLVRAQGSTVDDLLVGTDLIEETISDPTQEILWSSYVQLLRNFARIWPKGQLAELGEATIHAPSFLIIHDFASSFEHPVELYQLLVGPERHPGISILTQFHEVLNPLNLRIEFRIDPGYELTREFCEVQAGYFAVIPMTMGLPKANVELNMTAQSVVFSIELKRIRNPLARTWNRLRRRSSFLVSRSRLLNVVHGLNSRYEMAHRKIAQLSEQISRNRLVEERFARCFDDAPVAMLICRTSDYSIVDVNDKLLDAMGYERQEVMNWSPSQLAMWASPGDKVAMENAAEAADGAIEGHEALLRHRDGSEIVALLSSSPVEFDGESCILWQAIDITARKNGERELQRVHDHLEELVEERTRELRQSLDALQQVQRLASIGTLAAGVAHEINNPIASIRAASEFALMSKGGSAEDNIADYRDALETCVEQSERCGEIVHKVLRFSRGETGILVADDLRSIMIRSMRLVQDYAASRSVEIDSNLGEKEIPVFVNSIEIEQVFVNVLRNAIESGKEKTRVEVITRFLETGGFVEVRDNGVGIEPAKIPFLFDPFFTTRQAEGGTGLGLSVAHGIVNAHGGAIRVDSEVNRGTAIQIQFPLHDPESVPPALG